MADRREIWVGLCEAAQDPMNCATGRDRKFLRRRSNESRPLICADTQHGRCATGCRPPGGGPAPGSDYVSEKK